ncbi:hypothetical protein Ancab_023801 [Ancistrocladus abbreviatus]
MYYSVRRLISRSKLRAFSNLCTSRLTRLKFLQRNASYFGMFEQFSSAAKMDERRQSFMVSYLVNSCGLSAERALSVSLTYKLPFDSPEKPDAVLAFLKNHGFSDAHITKLLSAVPLVLVYYPPERTLLPKIKFFYSIGISRKELPNLICMWPIVMVRSLENHITPLYRFLKGILQSDEKVVATMRRLSWFQLDFKKTLCPNVTLLKEIGVPESKIGFLLFNFSRVMMIQHVEFRSLVDEVVELAFDASKTTFVLAIYVQWKVNKPTRDRCFKVYKEWGWSDDDISLAFKKSPLCLLLSGKKLMRISDFLMNKMGYTAGEIARTPFVLGLSLERRIIPRCSVLKVLFSKGLMEQNPGLSFALLCPEKKFLKYFVSKYHGITDELLSIYQDQANSFEVIQKGCVSSLYIAIFA